jgi:hypothetical protein
VLNLPAVARHQLALDDEGYKLVHQVSWRPPHLATLSGGLLEVTVRGGNPPASTCSGGDLVNN